MRIFGTKKIKLPKTSKNDGSSRDFFGARSAPAKTLIWENINKTHWKYLYRFRVPPLFVSVLDRSCLVALRPSRGPHGQCFLIIPDGRFFRRVSRAEKNTNETLHFWTFEPIPSFHLEKVRKISNIFLKSGFAIWFC